MNADIVSSPATTKRDWLLATGGALLEETETSARIRKGNSVATVDAFGKVTWVDEK